ncbi:MAG: NAD(P)/FAD-dependent oxidoreductase [Oligoflexales bacterium]
MNDDQDLIVIGAGAAGCFSAIQAVSQHSNLRCTVLEATRRPLTKVKVSGGGRCNVTHHCFEPKNLVKSYPRGQRELLGPFHKFQPQDMIQWLKDHGVETVVEADGRMFPASHKSTTIIDLFLKKIDQLGIHLEKGALVQRVEKTPKGWKVFLSQGRELKARYLVIATGGMPQGYKLAFELGHVMVDPMPSLFTFEIENPILKDLSGLSFPAACVDLKIGKKKFQQVGPVLMTHWGLSGPAVLKLSAFAARELFQENYHAPVQVNWLGWKKTKVVETLLQQKKHCSKNMMGKKNPFDVPKRFWFRVLELVDLDPEQLWAQLSTHQVESLSSLLCECQLHIQGKGVFKEEFVTSGGVSCKEVDFRTMESKLHQNLYFCGEILNIDGITGGFNFQNAWTTAWLAAGSIAEKERDLKLKITMVE